MKPNSPLSRLLRRFDALETPEAVLLAECWLRLFHLGLLRLLSPRGLSARVAAGLDPPPPAGPARRPDLAERTARIAGWAALVQPLPVTCLCRALALRDLLAHRRLPARLRIGVCLDGRPLQAHAWVEADGRALGEPAAQTQGFGTLERAARP